MRCITISGLLVFLFAISLTAQSGMRTYNPKADLNGELKGSLELFFSYDVEKTGKKDPESGLALNDVYERIYTASGETLFYGLKIGAIKAPINYLQKQLVKFIKSGDERWIVIEHYWQDGRLGTISQHCLLGEINEEAKVAFDKGKIVALYKGSDKFNAGLGIFSDQNYFSYINGKIAQKQYISVRTGVKVDIYENYDENGRLESVNYIEDTALLWMMKFYPNGELKSYYNYKEKIEENYDENGKRR